MDEFSKDATKQISGVLTEAYKDIVSPSAKPVGEIASFIPRTVKLALSK